MFSQLVELNNLYHDALFIYRVNKTLTLILLFFAYSHKVFLLIADLLCKDG